MLGLAKRVQRWKRASLCSHGLFVHRRIQGCVHWVLVRPMQAFSPGTPEISRSDGFLVAGVRSFTKAVDARETCFESIIIDYVAEPRVDSCTPGSWPGPGSEHEPALSEAAWVFELRSKQSPNCRDALEVERFIVESVKTRVWEPPLEAKVIKAAKWRRRVIAVMTQLCQQDQLLASKSLPSAAALRGSVQDEKTNMRFMDAPSPPRRIAFPSLRLTLLLAPRLALCSVGYRSSPRRAVAQQCGGAGVNSLDPPRTLWGEGGNSYPTYRGSRSCPAESCLHRLASPLLSFCCSRSSCSVTVLSPRLVPAPPPGPPRRHVLLHQDTR